MTQSQEPQNPQDTPTPSFWDKLLKGDESNPPLAQHPGVVIGTLICLFPVGAYFLWRYTRWDRRLKWGLTVGIPVLMLIGALLPDSPQSTSSGPSSSSSGNRSSERLDPLVRTATLTTAKIIQNNSWNGMTPNRFHQMMEQTARETGATEILPIKFKTEGPTHANGVTVLTQSFDDVVFCGYRLDGQPRLVKVEIDGKVYQPGANFGR